MMKNFWNVSELDRLLTIIYRPIAKIIIGIILVTLFFVSCVQIIDRRNFYALIKATAIDEAKKKTVNPANDSVIFTSDSNKVGKENDSNINNRKIIISNTNNYSSSSQKTNQDDSLLDVLSKSDGLINSNELTFCVTLIVSLLATLVVYKIETNEKNIKETILKEVSYRYISASKYEHLLIRIESVYNMTMLIGNTATMLLHARSDDESTHISTNIAHLCTRLSLLCSEIDDCLNKRKSRVDYLSIDEKSILDMYLEDALDALKRSLSLATRFRVIDLCTIIEGNINSVQDILEAIDEIELKETVLK